MANTDRRATTTIAVRRAIDARRSVRSVRRLVACSLPWRTDHRRSVRQTAGEVTFIEAYPLHWLQPAQPGTLFSPRVIKGSLRLWLGLVHEIRRASGRGRE